MTIETITLLPWHGFEQDQLEAAYAEVQNPQQYWKDVGGTWVPVEVMDIVGDAIMFFTGLKFDEIEHDVEGGWVRIRIAGYRYLIER